MKLPTDLEKHWSRQDYAATHYNVSGMSSIILMAPSADLESFRACVVKAQMELHRESAAPVFRLAVTFYDRPGQPFSFETFYNIKAESDRLNIELLGRQDELVFHMFDAATQEYVYSKTINWRQKQRRDIWRMLKLADAHALSIADYDFMAAKAKVIAV